MWASSRACAIGGLVAGIAAVRPAAASMVIALRDQAGHTRTFYQDGSRVRIANPSGTDDGEAQIVDLKTAERIVVYDDAKAYYDFNKSLAQLRAAVEQLRKTQPAERKTPPATVSYRPLGEKRQKNGFSCTLYERMADGKGNAQFCLAPWGGAVGPREDFDWFDALMDRMASDVAGKSAVPHIHMLALTEGLAVWMSTPGDHGGADAMEIVKLSRDPLPAALFHVPSDYKQFSRPLSASEHPHIGPPPMEDARAGSVDSTGRPSTRISGLVALVLAFGLIIGLLIHSALLHLAAGIVMERARFMQALVAAVIISGVLLVVQLIGLPPVIEVAFGAFTVFAALKISYGASVARTLALCVVSVLIVAGIALLARGCIPS